ncbi:MAG: hypothetical protein ACREAE_08465 [Nitrosopumilaceae archaeon]
MQYKEQIKENQLITKIRIIRYALKENIPVIEIAKSFSCHRNTIGNIIRTFQQIVPEEDRDLLLSAAHFSQEEIAKRYKILLNKKRAPKSHKKSALKADEEAIVLLYKQKNIKVGATQMRIILERRFGENTGLARLTRGQLRGIYKRNDLTTETVRSANGQRRHLYDYQAITAFAFMHYDVKHILDKHALPEDIYTLLAHNDAPIYQWNLMEVKTRTRFLAYSYGLYAEFGFRFLLFAIQYIRMILHNEKDQHIRIGMDNGLEFCLGSKKKEDEWNKILGVQNASVYQYDPNFDIRKNLIERSHKSDDELLYIPRGIYMTDKHAFHQEVIEYAEYWNRRRPHTGIGMNNRTPEQALKAQGLVGVDRLLQFPVLILEDSICQMRRCNQPIEFESFAREHPAVIQKSLTCQKTRRDIENQFSLHSDAQNVLTYYPNIIFPS